MKIVYFVILCCCIFSCKDKTVNKTASKAEIPYLPHLSLSLYATEIIYNTNIFYTIDIIDGEIIGKTYKELHSDMHSPAQVYRYLLTYEEHLDLVKLVSALNQKYDRSDNAMGYGDGIEACVLKVDGEVYLQQRDCVSWLEEEELCWKCGKCSEENSWKESNSKSYQSFRRLLDSLRSPPKEIGLLMSYITSLSLIPITEITSQACAECPALCNDSSISTPYMLPQSKIR